MRAERQASEDESCRQDRWLKVPFLLLSFVLWKHTLVTGRALRQHNVLTFNVTSSIKDWTDENPAGRQKLRVLFWMKISVWKPERYQLNYERPQGQGCDGWLWVPSWAQRAAESWSPASLLFCKGQEFIARLPGSREGSHIWAARLCPGKSQLLWNHICYLNHKTHRLNSLRY